MPDITSISWWREKTAKMGKFFGWGCMLIFALPLVIGFGWNQYSGRGNQADTGTTAVIAKINNEPVTKLKLLRAMNREAGSGIQYALVQGQAMDNLVQQMAITQLAKQNGVKASDADIDRRMAEEKKAVAKTESGWEDYVLQTHGMNLNEYRDALSREPSMLGQALITKAKSAERVTQDEVKALYDEVQLRTVLIPSGSSPFSQVKTKPLTDDEAKKKAEDLYAKVKAGGDMALISKENSSDFSAAKGAVSAWQKIESDRNVQSFGMLQLYGKDFKETIAKTLKGQLTNVVKASGFQKGYIFARVEDRRNTPPKDSDPKKAEDGIKQQRVTEKLGKEIEALYNAAKVEFTKDGADYKAYFDFYKLQADQQKMQNASQAMMMGQEAPMNVPTKADIDAKQKVVDVEIEALYKRHSEKGKEDPTAALLYSSIVKKRLATASQADKPALTQTLITLYESALNTTEDRQMRFELGDLYRDSKKNDLASGMYKKISHYMDIAPGFDTPSREEEAKVRQDLMVRFRSINDETDASKEQKTMVDLQTKIAEDKKKASAAVPKPAVKPQGTNGQKTGQAK